MSITSVARQLRVFSSGPEVVWHRSGVIWDKELINILGAEVNSTHLSALFLGRSAEKLPTQKYCRFQGGGLQKCTLKILFWRERSLEVPLKGAFG